MTVLIGVAACDGPPVLEADDVDEHAGQGYLNPPEVESGFEEPSPDAEGEIPLPLGFTEESWKEYLLEKVDEGIVVNYGGLDIVVAKIDHPLAYDGPVPNVELVFLEEDEMDALGVEPGDHAPGSTALDKHIYALAGDPSNIDSAIEGETTSKGWTDPPEENPEDNFWFDEVGSSLAFGSNSSIAITGCTNMGGWSLWSWWSWLSKPLLWNRKGSACFNGSYTGNVACVEVLYPSTPCPWSWQRTTLYAKMEETTSGTLIWFVSNPGVWVLVGEDGWDDIELFGDHEADYYPHRLKRVVVKHNDKSITSKAWYSPSVDLHSPGDSHDLFDLIEDHQHSLVFNSSNDIVLAAVSDYAQAATSKYPVYPHDELWSGYAEPITYEFTVPRVWCTEFASWAFREGAAETGYTGYGVLPEASFTDQDIGIMDMYNWGGAEGRIPLEFGQDEQGNPDLDNGPTPGEWSQLATLVKAGDYLARREEQPPFGDDVSAHSMVVVGWLSDDGTTIGSSNFDETRTCNRLLVVGGNVGGVGLPGSHGLGATVNVSKTVICRPDEDDDGFSIDPVCVIDGNIKECYVRLWDTIANDPTSSKSSFFIDMEMY